MGHSGQHHSMHQMAQTHKKLKKQQQGSPYGHSNGYMPGQMMKNEQKSRHNSQNLMKSKNNYGQQSKEISAKLEDYYSTSSDSEHDNDDSSTIASTDSDDEPHGHLDSTTDESSIVSDIL